MVTSSDCKPLRTIWPAGCALFAIAAIHSGCAMHLEHPVLDARVERYLELRREAAVEANRLEVTSEADELKKDVRELANAIQVRRGTADEGDMLGGEVGESIRAALAARLSREDGPRIIAGIMDVQPDMPPPAINARYPSEEPRSMMPPSVLRALPKVPDELSYRFVGRDLVLLDRRTGLVLDVLRDVLPAKLSQTAR